MRTPCRHVVALAILFPLIAHAAGGSDDGMADVDITEIDGLTPEQMKEVADKALASQQESREELANADKKIRKNAKTRDGMACLTDAIGEIDALLSISSKAKADMESFLAAGNRARANSSLRQVLIANGESGAQRMAANSDACLAGGAGTEGTTRSSSSSDLAANDGVSDDDAAYTANAALGADARGISVE